MKKLTALLCAFSLSLWLVGCAQQGTETPSGDTGGAAAPEEGTDAGAGATHEEEATPPAEGETPPAEPAPSGEAGSTTGESGT